jgi:hypothetical protein
MSTTINTKTTKKKFRMYYYNGFGCAIQYKFAKSIDTLILSKKVKEGLIEIDQLQFCPITEKYIETETYGADEIDSKPNLYLPKY